MKRRTRYDDEVQRNPLMAVERRQIKLAENTEATERWQRKLFRAANELQKLAKERKRLLSPRKPDSKVSADWTPDKYIGSGGGAVDDLNDDIPIL